MLAFAAAAGAFAALGGQHAGVAGVGVAPAQAGLQLAGQLAMERDVLKRSVALWVKDAMGRQRWPP